MQSAIVHMPVHVVTSGLWRFGCWMLHVVLSCLGQRVCMVLHHLCRQIAGSFVADESAIDRLCAALLHRASCMLNVVHGVLHVVFVVCCMLYVVYCSCGVPTAIHLRKIALLSKGMAKNSLIGPTETEYPKA